jgi:2-iminobutanoate/2-iminopropanoate deaminase
MSVPSLIFVFTTERKLLNCFCLWLLFVQTIHAQHPQKQEMKQGMKKEIIYTDHAPAPIGPYSQAVAAGNLIFVSGQIAIDPVSGAMVNGSIARETHQVMQNIKSILEKAGVDMQHILKTTIFLTNMDDFAEVNSVYSGYFQGQYPARETVQVARLPKNARVEISIIAYR